MSENGHHEIDPEVPGAYTDLKTALERLFAEMQRSSALGIDVGTAIAQHLRATLSPEQWEALPAPLRMMLG